MSLMKQYTMTTSASPRLNKRPYVDIKTSLMKYLSSLNLPETSPGHVRKDRGAEIFSASHNAFKYHYTYKKRKEKKDSVGVLPIEPLV